MRGFVCWTSSWSQWNGLKKRRRRISKRRSAPTSDDRPCRGYIGSQMSTLHLFFRATRKAAALHSDQRVVLSDVSGCSTRRHLYVCVWYRNESFLNCHSCVPSPSCMHLQILKVRMYECLLCSSNPPISGLWSTSYLTESKRKRLSDGALHERRIRRSTLSPELRHGQLKLTCCEENGLWEYHGQWCHQCHHDQPIHIYYFFKSVYDQKNEKLRPLIHIGESNTSIHLNVVNKCIIEVCEGL
jgi:hypothetical protein